MPAPAPRLDEAQDYLDSVITSLRAMDRREKQPLVGILEYLSEYIRSTRGEVAALRSTVGSPVVLAQASDELEEIVHETAKATNSIMSVAEDIEELSRQTDDTVATALQNAATRIYEACAFQDITGQRITKIVRAVQHLDQKIRLLAGLCGMEAPAEDNVSLGENQIRTGDESLLNGPQLAVAASSQDEIDRLFGA
ncbi:MAG TPA: protein phosphatase CheZ [Magnetospirillaceae bacterium]